MNATNLPGGWHFPSIQHVSIVDSERSTLPATIFALLVVGALTLIHRFILEPFLYGPLSHVPGPKSAGFSWYYLAYWDVRLCRNEKISKWHRKYGAGLFSSLAFALLSS